MHTNFIPRDQLKSHQPYNTCYNQDRWEFNGTWLSVETEVRMAKKAKKDKKEKKAKKGKKDKK
jgi:hypothetical protein